MYNYHIEILGNKTLKQEWLEKEIISSEINWDRVRSFYSIG
jgi:hypothetical protein